MNARDSEDECVAWEGRRWLVLFSSFPSLCRAFYFSSLADPNKERQRKENKQIQDRNDQEKIMENKDDR